MPDSLVFDHSLYSAAEVKGAVDAFGHLANFSLEENDGASTVTISDIQNDYTDILVDSFANYALEASIVANRIEAGGDLL